MSFKEYKQDQPFLLPLSLHDFLPDGHLTHVINERKYGKRKYMVEPVFGDMKYNLSANRQVGMFVTSDSLENCYRL